VEVEEVTVFQVTTELQVDQVEEVLEEEILQDLQYHQALDLVVLELVVKVMLVVLEILMHLYTLEEVEEAQVVLELLQHLLKVEMVELV
jgi:hypothetical protein